MATKRRPESLLATAPSIDRSTWLSAARCIMACICTSAILTALCHFVTTGPHGEAHIPPSGATTSVMMNFLNSFSRASVVTSFAAPARHTRTISTSGNDRSRASDARGMWRQEVIRSSGPERRRSLYQQAVSVAFSRVFWARSPSAKRPLARAALRFASSEN